MMFELAVGDAYGAGFEYVTGEAFFTRHNTLETFVQHPWHRLSPGSYTDDTQMAIAIAELVISKAEWTPLLVAETFLKVFHRNPRSGYSKRFQAFLEKTHSGEVFLTSIRNGSDKSGAAMRAGPIGLYPDVEEVMDRAALQAAVTHNTPGGIHAAQASALMCHYFFHDLGPKALLGEFLCDYVPGPWREPWTGEVGDKGWMSVQAAVTGVICADSMSSLLHQCVAWTGDTDTVAAIALAAASCSQEIDQDLPESLTLHLEDGEFGRDFLRSLDHDLIRMSENKGETE